MDTSTLIILTALAGVILFFYLKRRNARLSRED